MKITVTHEDGTAIDITEGVQVMYDVATGSMDWSSGFLDAEEEDAIVRPATACRFEDFAELAESVRKAREREEKLQEEGLRRKEAAARAEADRQQIEHLRGKGLWIP